MVIPERPMPLTLLLDAEVFAPEPRGRRHLLLGGGRILRILEEAPATAGLDVTAVDLAGRRLVPGFVDAHVHPTGGGAEAGYGSSTPPVEAETFLAAGVTSVVGVLGTDDLVRTPAQLVHAVLGLRAAGMSAWCHTGGYHLPPPTVTGSVRGDIVLVDPVIGVGEIAVSDHRSSQPTLDELLRLGAEAHVAGLMTGKAGVANLHLGTGPRGLDLVRRALDTAEIPARVWYPTHVSRRLALFEEALEIATRGVVLDVTATPGDGRALPEGSGDAVAASEAVARILGADLPDGCWTVSSDGGGSVGTTRDEHGRAKVRIGTSASLPELPRRLLARGIALEDALPGLTSNPADHLRLPRKGRIAEGADADLVALDEQANVHDVWARGVRRVEGG
jgi:beta-aspartyl-dipeptidase (metallo-type)